MDSVLLGTAYSDAGPEQPGPPSRHAFRAQRAVKHVVALASGEPALIVKPVVNGAGCIAIADQQRIDQHQPDAQLTDRGKVGQIARRYHDQPALRVSQLQFADQPPFPAAELFCSQRLDEVGHVFSGAQKTGQGGCEKSRYGAIGGNQLVCENLCNQLGAVMSFLDGLVSSVDVVVGAISDATDFISDNKGACAIGAAAVATVATGGLALACAPAIGAAVSAAGFGVAGGTLSGAAASSAGLAALGGGSLASGGLGMAGGTAVVTVTGGLAGGAVAGSAVSMASTAPTKPSMSTATVARSQLRTVVAPGADGERKGYFNIAAALDEAQRIVQQKPYGIRKG